MHGLFRMWIPTVALTALLTWPIAAGASSAQDSLRGLVGTWSCVTHSSDNKTYRETDVDTMYGNWLHVSSTYPGQNGQPEGSGTTFFGYDSTNKRWVVSGIGTDGSYFIATSSSPTIDGSHWSDQYPADGGTAVFHMIQTTQYTLDSQAPGDKGTTVTSHAICTRQ